MVFGFESATYGAMCRGTLQYINANRCFGCFGLLVCVLWGLVSALGSLRQFRLVAATEELLVGRPHLLWRHAAAAPLTGDLPTAGRGATVDRVACGVSGLCRNLVVASITKGYRCWLWLTCWLMFFGGLVCRSRVLGLRSISLRSRSGMMRKWIGDQVRIYRLILRATWKTRKSASRVSRRCPVADPHLCICDMCDCGDVL